MLNSDFLPLFFACLEAMDPISMMFFSYFMFTHLKGLDIVYRPTIPLHSSLFLISLSCLGVTEISLVLKLYWLTLDIGYGVSTCDERYSAHSSISL